MEKASWIGVRHIQVALLFGILVVAYGMRVNLSVGIVAMTDSSINPDFPVSITEKQYIYRLFPKYVSKFEDVIAITILCRNVAINIWPQSYDWSISMKSTMLSSFFWGYIVPQVVAGQLAERYGPRKFLTTTMLVSSIFTLIIPIMATQSAWHVIVCRIIQGFSQGFFFPCIQYLLSKWVPLTERSRMATFVYAGGPLGTVISMPITGWISASSLGWPAAFYLYGIIGLIWVVLWFWLGSNDPSEHGSISDKERKYIQQSTGDLSIERKYSTPWRHILTSLPVWALIIAYSGQHWGYWTLMTQIPTYMNGVLNYDIEANGLLSAAPYLALWLASFFFGYMSDFFINRNILSITNTRKLASGIGLIIPGIGLLILGMITNPERGQAIALLILSVGTNSAIFSGHQVNHIDISLKFAATLMGITNGIGNIFSLIAPLMVQYIVTEETDSSQWKIVFFISAATYIASDVFYTIFGKAELQYWDKLEENDEAKELNERIMIQQPIGYNR